MAAVAAPWHIVRLLAFTQIVAWGSLYYAFATLAPDVQREFGWRTELVFAAYSWSLLLSGIVSTPIGMLLDRFGGRLVMSGGSLLAGFGLILLATTQSYVHYLLAWSTLGIAMAMTMYEAAFATINREFFQDARKGISIVTLSGGLASTVFWPLTLKLNALFGWRDTLLVYAGVHVLLCLPLHTLLTARTLNATQDASSKSLHDTATNRTLQEAIRDPVFWRLAFAFAANLFVFSCLAAHLIPMLQRFGHSAETAVLVSALIGPMQFAGRLGEMTFGKHLAPQIVGKLVFGLLPVALLLLMLLGELTLAVIGFCLLYGVSNGILTIVRGTIPRALFGQAHYGAISGAMAGPSLIAKAAGPLAAAAFIQANPSPVWLLASLFVLSLVSLVCYLAAVKSHKASLFEMESSR